MTQPTDIGGGIIMPREKLVVPPRVKCPSCKKRFKPRVRECHDKDCWHIYLPAHKCMI